jgi:hypothetical protein
MVEDAVRNETWYAQGSQWVRIGQSPILPAVPPGPKPVMGAATQSDSSSSFSSLESQVGALRIRRSYSGAGAFPATYAASNAGLDAGVRESMWSFKPTPSAFAAGDNDSWFNGFLNSIPSGQKVIFILWHEPEDNIKNGEFTLAEWKAANNHLGQLVHAAGRPELRTAICLLGAWTFNPSSPYYTTNYWDSGFDTAIDYVGFDPYNQSTAFTRLDADVNFMRAMTWATTTHSKAVILPEFGCYDDPGGDATKKANWITDTYELALSSNMYAICYFNVNLTVTNVMLTTPESVAAYSNANANSKT